MVPSDQAHAHLQPVGLRLCRSTNQPPANKQPLDQTQPHPAAQSHTPCTANLPTSGRESNSHQLAGSPSPNNTHPRPHGDGTQGNCGHPQKIGQPVDSKGGAHLPTGAARSSTQSKPAPASHSSHQSRASEEQTSEGSHLSHSPTGDSQGAHLCGASQEPTALMSSHRRGEAPCPPSPLVGSTANSTLRPTRRAERARACRRRRRPPAPTSRCAARFGSPEVGPPRARSRDMLSSSSTRAQDGPSPHSGTDAAAASAAAFAAAVFRRAARCSPIQLYIWLISLQGFPPVR